MKLLFILYCIQLAFLTYPMNPPDHTASSWMDAPKIFFKSVAALLDESNALKSKTEENPIDSFPHQIEGSGRKLIKIRNNV